MNIYIRPDREVILKEFATKMKRSVSSLIGEFIDDLGKEYNKEIGKLEVEAQIKAMCEMPYCHQQAQGKYTVITNSGEEEKTLGLCVFHWNQARKEGEVKEVE